MSTQHGGWPDRRDDGTPPPVPPTRPLPPVPPAVGAPSGFGLPQGPPPGAPYGPPGYQFPPPPRRASAARTALVAGLAGAVVVVAAAAVLLAVMLGDDDKKGQEAAPSRSAAATAPAAPAPGTTGAAPDTSRGPDGATPFPLPATVDGAPRVPDDEVPANVRDIDAVFSRDFDAVTTVVYHREGDADSMLLSTGVMRDVVPADFVRDFVPKTDTAAEADAAASLWRHPGLMRCWYGRSTVCLWGDDARMLFASARTAAPDLVAQMERVYLDGSRDRE